jgi:hypothetical protein
MNFKLKYLKYKKKYLELKNQSGGKFDCKKDLYNLPLNDICEEIQDGEFFDIQSCINSVRCNNKWRNANNFINKIIKNPFIFKFDTFLDALKFKYSNKDSTDNLVNISVYELKIEDIDAYTALNKFNTIYADYVSLDIRENIDINLTEFFNKIKKVIKLKTKYIPTEVNVLPQSLTHLTILDHFNQPIGVDVLPKNLTHLVFHTYSFNQPIEVDVLPKNLTHLTFGSGFNRLIGVDVLPKNLTHLTFGNDFNEPIGVDVLPKKLTHLTFGSSFNRLIGVDVLPKNLTHLTFGDEFDQPIGVNVLPRNLTHLTLNYIHNIPMGVGVLRNLTHLTFSDSFNQPIGVGVLPQNLTHLTFGHSFNRLIGVDVLPQNLTHLTFGNEFDQPIGVNVLPRNLTHLTFGSRFNTPIGVGVLPNLTYLSFDPNFGKYNWRNNYMYNFDDQNSYGDYFYRDYDVEKYSFNQEIGENVLPISLTHLIFSFKFNKPLGNSLNRLENLTHLAFGCKFNKPIGLGELPPNLIHLKLGVNYDPIFNEDILYYDEQDECSHRIEYEYNLWCFNQPIEVGVLPQSLTHLTFSVKFNQPIEVDVLPQNLTHLTFGSKFNKPIGLDVLPQNLTYLMFGNCFNQKIEVGVLPQSLTELIFTSKFNKPIGLEVLPTNLTHLVFGDSFNHRIKENVLPQSLNYLIFSNNSIYNHQLDLNILPSNLTHLYLGKYFNEPIVLPQSLTHLDICNKEHEQINLLYNKFKFINKFDRFNEFKYCENNTTDYRHYTGIYGRDEDEDEYDENEF